MSQKPKNEPVSTIRYYWSRFLFARRFVAEVHAPPDEVARMIDAIEEKEEWLKSRSQESSVSQPGDGIYAFTARVKRQSGSFRLDAVRAKGRILYSKGHEVTMINGDLRLGWFYYMIIIFQLTYVLFFSLSILRLPLSTLSWSILPYLTLASAMLLFFAWSFKQVFDDYTLLTDQLEQIVNAADPVRTG